VEGSRRSGQPGQRPGPGRPRARPPPPPETHDTTRRGPGQAWHRGKDLRVRNQFETGLELGSWDTYMRTELIRSRNEFGSGYKSMRTGSI
jgi:hypothetical protein